MTTNEERTIRKNLVGARDGEDIVTQKFVLSLMKNKINPLS